MISSTAFFFTNLEVVISLILLFSFFGKFWILNFDKSTPFGITSTSFLCPIFLAHPARNVDMACTLDAFLKPQYKSGRKKKIRSRLNTCVNGSPSCKVKEYGVLSPQILAMATGKSI